MNLTPENIERINALLADRVAGMGARELIIKHNLSDLTALNGFFRILCDCGLDVTSMKRKLRSAQKLEFEEYLRLKRARADSNSATREAAL